MALAETANLVVKLSLGGNFQSQMKAAQGSVGRFSQKLKETESTAYRVGQRIGGGIQSAARNIAKAGVIAGAGLAFFVHQGIDSLATLEDATTAVSAAIKQTGQVGKVTAGQVADWANQIENSVQAAFDDKDITRNAAVLLRYGKVTAANLRPALVVMTDLAAKTGDVDSAAQLLAKALADPEKAAGKLARTGVVLTKSQQAQIKALVKAGKTAQAQTLLLRLLSKTTAGAAAASAGPYRDALNTLKDVTEDAERALAIGFLPVLEKVAGILKTGLSNPANVQAIKDFGSGLAGGLDQVIGIAQKVPWGKIGDGLRIAGAGAKAILDAFTSLPDWVQTAVITGWGLNKLTGGAVGGIIGELGKGLIKGVLGINAGVVSINAGVVNGGGGGLPGAAGAAGAAGISTAAALVPIASAVAVSVLSTLQYADKNNALKSQGLNPAEITAVKYFQSSQADQQVAFKHLGYLPTKADLNSALAKLNPTVTGGLSPTGKVGRDVLNESIDKVNAHVGDLTSAADAGFTSVTGAVGTAKSAVDSAKSGISAAVFSGTGMVAAAVRNNPPPIVNVNVSVTPAAIQKTTTIVNRYGPQNGSAGGNGANPDRQPRD